MSLLRPRYSLPLVVFVLLALLILWPAPVDAQCGTQASSCKNCHEVQGEYPVSTEGDWHVQHAFGDFCEFCHAGNVTATDQDGAHSGMLYPLDDPAGSCASCHPMDYNDLAIGYAGTLGVDVGSAGGTDGGGDSGGGDEAAPPPDEVANAEDAAPAEESSGDVIDLNARHDIATRDQRGPLNAGDLILAVMLVGLVAAFGVLIWRFEGLGEKWAALRGRPLQPAYAMPGGGSMAYDGPATSPAIEALVPSLEQANPATLAAINKLLQDDPERGGQMIEALANIDPRLVEVVRRLDERDLDMLVALVRELKARG